MNGDIWLNEIRSLYRRYKSDCERAIGQVSEQDFFTPLDPESNSVAIIMKHIACNHRSRWRDFLTTDGEKVDRNRDSEFTTEGETRSSIYETWEEGWQIAFESLESLTSADLERTITIRGQPLSIVQALLRNLNHVAYHMGQIVQLARHLTGDSWQTLSITRGKSQEYNAEMRKKYGDWWAKS